jgi:Flp pilus assembly protein TadD
VASFVTLSLGFAAGYWMGRQESPTAQLGAAGSAPHPVGPSEYLQLGTQSLEAGDVAAAERYFREAVALDPGSARARADLGATLMMQGRWDDATVELEAARAAEPSNPEAWFLTGMLERDGYGNAAGAREAWGRFLEIMPEDSPQAETVRGWLADLDATIAGRDTAPAPDTTAP